MTETTAPTASIVSAGSLRLQGTGTFSLTSPNAVGTLALREAGTPLPELVWAHRPGSRRAPRSFKDLQSTTPESVALSKALKRTGFRFVGPTTVYATMQACGVVNDHLATCHVRAAVERLSPA